MPRETNERSAIEARFAEVFGHLGLIRAYASRRGAHDPVPGGRARGHARISDVPMLHHAGRKGLRLLVLHDDPDREFDYVEGAETSLERVATDGWTVVSIRNDWATVLGDT